MPAGSPSRLVTSATAGQREPERCPVTHPPPVFLAVKRTGSIGGAHSAKERAHFPARALGSNARSSCGRVDRVAGRGGRPNHDRTDRRRGRELQREQTRGWSLAPHATTDSATQRPSVD